MPDRFPPITPVRTRGAFATTAGAHRASDDQAVAYLSDREAAFVGLVRGMWHARSGRPIADLILDHAVRMFRERTSSMLDDLAELWWTSEHEGARVRPFASLPIVERADLRARVKRLLVERVPDALGDQAVLEGETRRILDIPVTALRRANADLERKVERDHPRWAGAGGAAMHAIFAADRLSIAHLGDCRAVRLRRGVVDILTREHTLQRDYEDANGADVPAPEHLAHGVITRAVGGLIGRGPDLVDVSLSKGDLVLFLSRGAHEHFTSATLKDILLRHGVEAATKLVEQARTTAPENVAAVAVEVL